MSGLPATGKSAVADAIGRQVGAAVLSVDPIEAAIWRCGIPPSFETGVAAYEVAATLAAHQLSLGLLVVIDSVSSLEVARDMWREAAQKGGSEITAIEVICSDEQLHRKRLASRRRTIPGFPEPSWDDVQLRRDEWEPWVGDRLVLDTIRSLEDNVGQVLSHLKG